MKCGYLLKKYFASDIFCAGAKFNVTLSIMTLNADVFLSPMMLSSCVCLVSSVSHRSESLLLCLQSWASGDIQLWLVDNLCHKYRDGHLQIDGPGSGVWVQTIISDLAHLTLSTLGQHPARGQSWLSTNQFLSVVVFSQHRRADKLSVSERKLGAKPGILGPICGRSAASKCDF